LLGHSVVKQQQTLRNATDAASMNGVFQDLAEAKASGSTFWVVQHQPSYYFVNELQKHMHETDFD